MQSVTLLCVGKLKEAFWANACREYEKRLGAFCKLNVVEVEEQRCPDRPGPGDIAAVLQKEGRRLLQKIPDGAAVAAFCIEGKPLSSPAFADYIAQTALAGRSHLVLIIGGSFGLSDEVKARADARLSVSPMTFPHQLFRVMALEQVYRAFQINAGGKYHK